jgi:hypothetical protein
MEEKPMGTFDLNRAELEETARLSLEENQPTFYQKIKDDPDKLEAEIKAKVDNAFQIYQSLIEKGEEPGWAYQVATEAIPFPPEMEDEEEMEIQDKVMADFEDYLIQQNRK